MFLALGAPDCPLGRAQVLSASDVHSFGTVIAGACI